MSSSTSKAVKLSYNITTKINKQNLQMDVVMETVVGGGRIKRCTDRVIMNTHIVEK